jgi:hypothetical protein
LVDPLTASSIAPGGGQSVVAFASGATVHRQKIAVSHIKNRTKNYFVHARSSPHGGQLVIV